MFFSRGDGRGNDEELTQEKLLMRTESLKSSVDEAMKLGKIVHRLLLELLIPLEKPETCSFPQLKKNATVIVTLL